VALLFSLLTWKNYFRASFGKLTYTVKARENVLGYLQEADDISREVSEENGIEYDGLPISNDPKITGFHCAVFRKFYDGKPNQFLEAFVMEIILNRYQVARNKFKADWKQVYEDFVKHCEVSSEKFNNGYRLGNQSGKVKYDIYKELFKKYLDIPKLEREKFIDDLIRKKKKNK